MADHILEMVGLGLLCDYCLIKKYCLNQVTYVECRELFLRSKTTEKYQFILLVDHILENLRLAFFNGFNNKYIYKSI